MRGKRIFATLLAVGLALGACSSNQGPTSEGTAVSSGVSGQKQLEKIQAFVPTTMAFGAPMIGFGKEGNLQNFSSQVSVSTWDSVEQLKSSLINGEVEVAATPAYVAANLYNKGVKLKFVGPVVWGMLYVMGPDGAQQGDWNALKGKTVVVTNPGNMPDLVFTYLLGQQGMSKNDFQVMEVQDGKQAIQALAQGKADFAVLPEHVATLAEIKLKEQGKIVSRALNLQEEWGKVTGKETRFPMAGLVMPAQLADDNPGLVQAVRAEINASVSKANNADPATIAAIAQHYGLPETVVARVIPNLQLNVVSAQEARGEYEDFLSRLGEVNPQIYGGKLPDDAFYLG